MWKEQTQKPSKQMTEAINAVLGDVSHVHPEPVVVINHLVHCAKVLSGSKEGTKKDAKADICMALGLKGNTSYANASASVMELIEIADGSFTNPEGVGQMLNNLVVDEAEEVNDEVVEEVNTEVVAPATTPVDVSDINGLVASAVAEATAGLMAQMQSMIASLSTPTAPAVVEPKPQPTVEPEAAESSDEESDSPFLIKPTWNSPKGWKDKQHYSVGIVTDTIGTSTDGKYGCFTVKNVDANKATETARRLVLRQIITAVDRVNGNKSLTKATQKDDWVSVAASHGITDAVVDTFITNPNTFLQQTRRTSESMRSRLGIDSAEAFGELVVAMIANPPQPSVAPKTTAPLTSRPSTSLMDAEEATAPAVATLDPEAVKDVMATFGMTFAEAKAFLTE